MRIYKLVSLALVLSLCLMFLVPLSAQEFRFHKQYNTPTDYLKATGKRISKFSESPVLAELVKQGKLPPVKERLPKEPIVIDPVEEIGQYGGTARVIGPINGYGDTEALRPHEGILRVGPDGFSVVPNIAKGWKFSQDGKVLTIYLREGMKWSDGEPFTADDIMFWYEDVLQNNELTPTKPVEWSPGGKLMKLEKVNNYTVRAHFAVPYPVAIIHLAHSAGVAGRFFLPKHYLMKFHPKYTPMDKIMEQAKKEGFDTWYKYFQKYADYYSGGGMAIQPGAPTLQTFYIEKKELDHVVLKRNPYYWKVDTAGNQLPYIDEVSVTDISNPEVANVKIASGEVDIAELNTTMENYPFYVENKDKGNYRVLLWQSIIGADVAYQLNLTYKEDPVLRDIFRDVRFRKALSLGLNRNEINQLLYLGRATPRQATVIPQSPYFDESFAKAYIEYNPQEANRLLDEMGLKKGPDGYRLRPDGKRLEILLEYEEGETPKGKTTEMAVHYWDALGIKVTAKEISGSLKSQRTSANLIQFGLWHADRAGFLFTVEPYYWVPTEVRSEAPWCVEWARWFASGGKAGEEPPPEIKKIREDWDRMKTTMDEKERIRLAKEILKSNAENLWTIGTVGLAPHPVIVRNNLRNVPEKGLWGWDLRRFTSYAPETFFFKQK